MDTGIDMDSGLDRGLGMAAVTGFSRQSDDILFEARRPSDDVLRKARRCSDDIILKARGRVKMSNLKPGKSKLFDADLSVDLQTQKK